MTYIDNVRLERGSEHVTMLRDVFKDKNPIIAGGFARWCLAPQREPAIFGDIDIYPDKHDASELCELLSPHWHDMRLSDVSISGTIDGLQLQIIKPHKRLGVVTQGLTDILNAFDFTVVQAGFYLQFDKAVIHEDFWYCEANQVLALRGEINNPFNSLHTERLLKASMPCGVSIPH